VEAQQPQGVLKIGYMPLAHDVYWKYFPEYEQPTAELGERLRVFLGQFGALVETGELIDSVPRAEQARRLFQAEDVDIIVMASATYSTPDDVILDLKRFPRPIVIWNTQQSAAIPPDMDFGMWMLEHGVTGVPGITNLLERARMPYFLITGHHSQPAVKTSFDTVMKAVAAFKRVWGSRLGMVGHLYPGMLDFGYDPTSMYTTFGASTVPISERAMVGAFEAAAAGASAGEVAALREQLDALYSRDAALPEEEYVRSLQTAVALKTVVEENELDAVTMYCQSLWQRPEMGVVPCLGMSLLMQQGTFFSCEGDVPTALSGLILQTMSGAAFFTEIWCNDLANDQFMMGHSGTMNLSLFQDRQQDIGIVRHPWWDGCCGRGACLEVHRMPPGQGTMLCLSPGKDNRWRMIVSKPLVVERDPVPLGAPNFFVELEKPIGTYLQDLAALGAAHHFAMAYGDWTAHLQALAKILQIEYSLV